MESIPNPVCGEHQINKKWGETTFEYSDEGITIQVPNVPAWICPLDGEASFTPEMVDEIIFTVRELIEIAKKARERRSVFTEYIVAVS
ncbi:MAG: YgiT-type zinc finger protein [Chloroflexi bacterium]|nr:YgiT-type zinc finger protein [Chloroflexota bacterium]